MCGFTVFKGCICMVTKYPQNQWKRRGNLSYLYIFLKGKNWGFKVGYNISSIVKLTWLWPFNIYFYQPSCLLWGQSTSKWSHLWFYMQCQRDRYFSSFQKIYRSASPRVEQFNWWWAMETVRKYQLKHMPTKNFNLIVYYRNREKNSSI